MPINDIAQCSSWCQPRAGVMDLSWLIQWTDGRQTHGRVQMPPAPSNTTVRSAYLALMEMVTMYVSQGGQGPLYVINAPVVFVEAQRRKDLALCWPAIAACLQQVRQGVHLIGQDLAWPADQATEAIYAVTPAEVSPVLANQIARLNLRGVATWQDYVQLHCGGRDHYSALYFPTLARLVGPVGVERVLQAFVSPYLADAQASVSALRWIARGLAAHLAIEKARVDLHDRQRNMVRRTQHG